jgi:glycerol kinase
MLIGIDIGTQSLKVVVTDESLKVCGEASVHYALSYPQPSWAYSRHTIYGFYKIEECPQSDQQRKLREECLTPLIDP